MAGKALFVAATGQHVGKTTVCLGLLAGLMQRYEKVGFIKPVGQEHYKVANDLHVDKDCILFKEAFNLNCAYEDMSPVIIPKGFTKEYLDGKHDTVSMRLRIREAFERISSQNDFTLIEGTGHVGVGSVVELSNAAVAADLDVEVILVSSAGIGAAFDQLAVNKALFDMHRVKIKALLLNRVEESRRQTLMEYFPKAVRRWDIPLAGCIPFNNFLDLPTIKDFENLLKSQLLSGESHRMRHFKHTRLVATSLPAYQELMIPNQLIITPASREDIVLATLERHHTYAKNNPGEDFGGGMILSGRHRPSEQLIEAILASDVPILYAAGTSYDLMKTITSFTAKIRQEDTSKVQQAIRTVRSHLDFDLICS